MAINWGLGVMPDVVGNALAAFEEGRTRKAYSALATNPDDPAARQVLFRNDPKGAMLWERQRAEAEAKKTDLQEKQKSAQLEQAKQLAAIVRQVKADPSRYPLARSAAIQLGVPATSIPEQFDPQWIDKQDMIFSAFNEDGGKSLTTLAQNVMMTLPPEQRDPNSPVFVEAFNKAFIAEQTKTIPFTQGGGVAGYNAYTGQTNTIIAPNPGGMPTGAPVQSGGTGGGGQNGRFTFDMYRGAASTQGKAWADNWIMKNGFRVSVRTPQEARQLPKGTPIILPDGTEGVVP